MSGRIRALRPGKNFAAISNEFLRLTQDQLSLSAFRVACFMLSHNETYRTSQASIARLTGLSTRTVATALAELEQKGYLERVQNREGNRRAADDYVISSRPLGPADSASADFAPAESAGLEEDHSSKKTNNLKNPPGGEDFVPAPDGGMFPAPEKPEPEFSAGTVVAAYVDSYRAKTGKDPVKRFIAQVGREAKRLIDEGEEPDGLLAAASALGRTAFASLERQFVLAQHGGQASPARRSMPGPGVVHTREEIAQQERAFAAMPAATVLSPEEMEAFIEQELGELA